MDSLVHSFLHWHTACWFIHFYSKHSKIDQNQEWYCTSFAMFDIQNSKFKNMIIHVNLFKSLMINPSLCLFRKACLGSFVKFWLNLKWLQSIASSSYSKSNCCAFDPEPNNIQRSLSHWSSSCGRKKQQSLSNNIFQPGWSYCLEDCHGG